MVPNAAMGANQAIEGAATLANELGPVLLGSHPSSQHRAEELRLSLSRYTSKRQPRSEQIFQRAGIVCRAQLCHGSPAAAVLKELPTLTDGDWLFRGFMSFAGAPADRGYSSHSPGCTVQGCNSEVSDKCKGPKRRESRTPPFSPPRNYKPRINSLFLIMY